MAPSNLSIETIDRFIGRGNPLAKAGGARLLAQATGGNLAGAAFLAALAKKESSFGATAGRFRNNFWGWGVHLGPEVNTSSSVLEGAAKVWKGLNSGLYKGAGLVRPADIINRYAPPSENNTALYKQQVGQWFSQLGLDPNTDIFQSGGLGLPAGAGGAASPPALPATFDAGQLDVKRLMGILGATRQRVLAGQMPGPNYQRELQKLAAAAVPRAQTVSTAQGVGAMAQGAAQAVKFSMGGGPEAHHSRALGNWQSDDAYDLMGKAGDPVPSYVSGVVTKVSGKPGGDPGFAGYGVTVRTPQGDLFFKHLGTINVKPGQRITPKTLIGTLDPSTAGGPHLHLGGTNRKLIDRLASLYTGRS